MSASAVIIQCDACHSAIRVLSDEEPRPSARAERVTCPKCSAPLSETCMPSTAEVVPRLDLEHAQTQAGPDGRACYTVMLHHSGGGVSYPLLWPPPLPEVLILGAPDELRAYRLQEVAGGWVWYSESQQRDHEISEQHRQRLQEALEALSAPAKA